MSFNLRPIIKIVTARPRIGRQLGLLAIASALLLGGAHAPSFARDDVDVESIAAGGYGRMVLTFKDKNLIPTHSTATDSGVLRLNFQEPIDTDISRVPVTLSDYVSVARLDPEGRGVRLALKRGVQVNIMEAGEKLFVDFLPANWRGLPPALPEDVVRALAKRAEIALRALEDAEKKEKIGIETKLMIRYGDLPTFARLVFEWNVSFDSKLEREKNIISVGFDRDTDFDLDRLRPLLPAVFSEIGMKKIDDRLTFFFPVDPNVEVRGFRERNTYVIDVTKSKDGGAEVPLAAALLQQSDQVAAQTPVKQDPVRMLPEVAEAADVATPADAISTQKQVATRQVALPQLAPVEPKQDQDVVTHPEKTVAAEVEPGEGSLVHVVEVGNTIQANFQFKNPVPAAIFRRGADVWLVFDTVFDPNLGQFQQALGRSLVRASKLDLDGAVAVRLELKEPTFTSVTTEGSSWNVIMGDVIAAPSGELALTPSVTARGKSILHTNFPGGGRVHRLVDPVVGDEILVATAFGPARGLIREQRFAELTTLVSGHGMAILPLADDVTLDLQALEAIVQRPGGLSLSGNLVNSMNRNRGEQSVEHRAGAIDFQALRAGSPVQYRRNEIALKNEISTAEEAKVNEARLQLARFYLANDYAAEALGLLNVVARSDASRDSDPDIQVLKAAAEVRLGRVDTAVSRLEKSEFERSGDASVWKTIGYAKQLDWAKSLENARRAVPVLTNYSPALVSDFYLAAARAALGVNDLNAAKDYLSSLRVDGMDHVALAEFDTLLGYLSDASGKKADAVAAFERAIESAVRPAVAEAKHGLMHIYHRDGDLSAEEIIPELEQMVTVWRGDQTELENRQLLAKLYVQNGQYRSAFDSMKSAVMGAPGAATTRDIQDEMNGVFVSLYLDGIADTMAPDEALSLFYDFRELTPVGRQGDEIVRRLADRLISVDLLDQATALLAHQVDHRLKGAARAQIASDLAIIYLINEEADKALALLRRTRLAGLPRQLEHQRLIVEARALARTGKTDMAVDLLSGFVTPDARQAIAEIYWQAERWQQAAEQFELKHQSRWSDPVPLTALERIEILKAAIGYSLASDEIGLTRLRGKYADKMSASLDAAAFETVTKPIENNGIEFRAVIKKVAAIDTMEQFLETYRKTYMSQPVLGGNSI